MPKVVVYVDTKIDRWELARLVAKLPSCVAHRLSTPGSLLTSADISISVPPVGEFDCLTHNVEVVIEASRTPDRESIHDVASRGIYQDVRSYVPERLTLYAWTKLVDGRWHDS